MIIINFNQKYLLLLIHKNKLIINLPSVSTGESIVDLQIIINLTNHTKIVTNKIYSKNNFYKAKIYKKIKIYSII
jgi:hypothetical protein